MHARLWLSIIASLIVVSGCAATPGKFVDRKANEFLVVQKQGQTHEEYFLCNKDSNLCNPSQKTPVVNEILGDEDSLRKAENNDSDLNRYSSNEKHNRIINDFLDGKSLPIFFDFESAALTDDSNILISDVAKVIKIKALKKVAIKGETDAFGSRGYNDALANKRVESVMRIFASYDVSLETFVESKNARCCRKDAPNAQSIAAASEERVVLLRMQTKDD